MSSFDHVGQFPTASYSSLGIKSESDVESDQKRKPESNKIKWSKIEEVTFQPIGNRLANALLKRPREGDKVNVTHEELAAEIGTAREVISRKIALWQKEGLVDRGRGNLLLIDIDQLHRIANTLDS